jgi:TrmH family RNA methyltransferase
MHKLESRDNPYVKHLRKLVEDSAYRHEMQKVVVEGKQQIEELLPFVKSGTVFSVEPWKHTAFQNVLISETVANKLGSKVLVELPMPKLALPEKCTRLLALDGVSDPGNLGTLLRTALALGWDGVFLLPGSCDPFNDKALRASKGAIFKLPYKKGAWDEFDQLVKTHHLMPLAADLEGVRPETLTKEKCFLILGNEGQGLSIEGRARGEKVCIPMRGEMESLNVGAAGAILMYILGNHD